MPSTYDLFSEKTGQSYKVDFEKPPSDKDVDEAINHFDSSAPAPSSAGLPEPDSALGAFTRTAGTRIIPAVATGLGGIGGATLGAVGGPVGVVAGDIAGGMAAGTAAKLAQDTALGPMTVQALEMQEKANEAAHPWATKAGALVGDLPAFFAGGPIKPKGIIEATGEGATVAASKLKLWEHGVNSTVVGARLGGSTGAQDVATGKTEGGFDSAQHILDSMARSAVSLGAAGMVPGARSFLGAVLGKAPGDAAAMAVADAVYGSAIHGEEIDVKSIAQHTGSELPAFMIMNALTHGMAVMKPVRTTVDGQQFFRDPTGVWSRVKVPGSLEEGTNVLQRLDGWKEKPLIDILEGKHQGFLKSDAGQKFLAEQQTVKEQAQRTAEGPAKESLGQSVPAAPPTETLGRPKPNEPINPTAPEVPAGVPPEPAAPGAPQEAVKPGAADVLPTEPVAPAEVPPSDVSAQKPAEVLPPEPVPAEPATPETAPSTPVEPPKAAEPAIPAPGDPAKGPTSIQNEVVDKERKARGLPSLFTSAKQSFGQWWDAAMIKVDQDPRAGAKLVDELNTKNRVVNAEETALLSHELLSRENAFDKAMDEVNAATDANRAEKVAALDRAREDFDTASTVTKNSGSEVARALVSRQMMINRDFTLAEMERRTRAEANDGKPLSPNQAAWVKDLHREMTEQMKESGKLDEEAVGKLVQHHFEQAMKEVKTERDAAVAESNKLREEAKTGSSTTTPKKELSADKLKALADRMHAKRDAARERIRASMGQTNASIIGFNPANLADYATIVASYIVDGVKGVSDLTKKLVGEFGPGVEAHAGNIIKEAGIIHERERASVSKDSRDVMEQVAANAKEGKAPAPRLIKELVKEQIIDGVTDHKKAIANVTQKLEAHHPGITERQVSDLFSGYGKVAFPSKEDIDVKMREVLRLRQLSSAIEDAMAKRAPLKSGAQRDKTTQDIRAMQKELVKVMRDNGIESTTAEQQLKTSLDGVKSRLKNAIEDLEKQIATGEKTPRKPGVDYDAEALGLKAEVQKLRDVVAEMEGPKVKTFEERRDEATKAVTRSIENLERKIKDKDFSSHASEPVLTAQLQVLRDSRDALQEHFQKMKEAELGKPTLTEEQRTHMAVETTGKAIKELDRRIREKDFGKKGKPVDVSAELAGLRAQKNALSETYQQLKETALGKPTLTDEQRVKMATTALEKSITDLDARVKAGDIAARTKTSKTPLTAKLQVMRDTRDALQKELKKMRKQAEDMARDPVAEQIKRDVAAIEARTKNLDERIKKGEFSPPAPREKSRDPRIEKAQFKYEEAKAKFVEGVFQARLARRTPVQKLFGAMQEVLNTSRAVLTAADASGVFRQGAILTFSHPIIAARALKPMFEAMMSKEGDFRAQQAIKENPEYKSGLMDRAGLDITTNDATSSLSKREEAYMSRWLDKLPTAAGGGIIRGSERGYRTYLNKLRADTFSTMVNALRKGAEPTLGEAKAIAEGINIFTGRGDLGKLNQAATALNTVYFAPKLVASRFQTLFFAPLWKGSNRTRVLMAQEYARFLIGVSTFYALATMFQDGEDPVVSFDPRSSDFGKVRFGNTRVDPLAGLGQATVLLGRLGSGEKVNSKGKVVALRGEKVPYGSDDAYDVMANFARSKFSPIFGSVINVAAGKNVVGEKTDLATEAARNVVPMSVPSIIEAMEDQGMSKGAALSILSLLGMGVQTYDTKKKTQ